MALALIWLLPGCYCGSYVTVEDWEAVGASLSAVNQIVTQRSHFLSLGMATLTLNRVVMRRYWSEARFGCRMPQNDYRARAEREFFVNYILLEGFNFAVYRPISATVS